jgi:hypothetical protein
MLTPTSPVLLRGAQRRVAILRCRSAGMTQAAIATKVGVCRQRVGAVIRSEVKKLNEQRTELAAQLVDDQRRKLDELLAVYQPLALKGDVKAANTVLAVLGRLSKLMGLDAPDREKMEITGGVNRYDAYGVEKLRQMARQMGLPVAADQDDQDQPSVTV